MNFATKPSYRATQRGDLVLVGVDHALQGFELERRGEPRGIDDVAEHHRQVALFGGRPSCSSSEPFGRRRSAR